jgi:hypothetical protein
MFFGGGGGLDIHKKLTSNYISTSYAAQEVSKRSYKLCFQLDALVLPKIKCGHWS